MYSRCCPSCNAWASNQIGVGCLPSGEQESEIQKIISYSYEDITSDSEGEMDPQKEATICNLCEELHKKRKPIDAFTELVEIESTTETIHDYESLTDPLIKEPYDSKDKKMQENTQSTTNSNNLEQSSMEIETTKNKFGLDLDQLKEEILEEKKESKRGKEKESTITESKEEIISDDTSSDSFKKPTKKEGSFKEENVNQTDEEIIYYDETSSQVTKNNNKSPNQKKVHNEEILKNNKKDTEMEEYDESSQENIIEKKTDKFKDESKSSKEVSVEKESENHEKKKSKEAKFEKEESSGSGDESSSGSGGSDDDDDIYNGYGDNIATLKLGKSFLTYLFIKVAKVQMLIILTE